MEGLFLKITNHTSIKKPLPSLAAAFSLSFAREHLLAVGLLVFIGEVNPFASSASTHFPDELVEREVVHHPEVDVA